MSNKSAGFDSLSAALIDWFEKPFTDLPRGIRERVEREFAPLRWDGMMPHERKSRAESWDYQHDPATEEEREFWWDFFLRKREIEKQIVEWEAVATPNAGDLAQKESRLTELRQKLGDMERESAENDGRGEALGNPCRPVRASQIRLNFPVDTDVDTNEEWWKEKMRDARRNGLLVCRVGEGKKGQRGGSLWRPDLVAAWLLDRHTKGRKGLHADAIRAALKKFRGCEEAAHQLFASDE